MIMGNTTVWPNIPGVRPDDRVAIMRGQFPRVRLLSLEVSEKKA